MALVGAITARARRQVKPLAAELDEKRQSACSRPSNVPATSQVASSYAARGGPPLDGGQHPPRTGGVPAEFRRLPALSGVPRQWAARTLAGDGQAWRA